MNCDVCGKKISLRKAMYLRIIIVCGECEKQSKKCDYQEIPYDVRALFLYVGLIFGLFVGIVLGVTL